MNYLYRGIIINFDYINNNSTETILLLHGFGGNKNSFLSLEKSLPKSFNILKITLPTLESIPVTFTMFDYVKIVVNILKSLHLKDVIVICHSFGFRVSLLMNLNYKNVSKIIVTGGAGLISKKHFLKKLQLNKNKIMFKTKFCNLYYNKYASTDYKSLPKENKETFKNITGLNLFNAVNYLQIPTLLFWGNKDKSTPLAFAKIYHKKILKSKLVITKGTHFAYLENKEQFSFLVNRFLKGNL